jgi:hypothetical protein
VFLINSWQGYFSCGPFQGKPYSEVTAAFLPSSLENSHSFVLLYSSRSPVSVCGTVFKNLCLEIFLEGLLYYVTMGEPTISYITWSAIKSSLPDFPGKHPDDTDPNPIMGVIY